jgi:hypothetical protein
MHVVGGLRARMVVQRHPVLAARRLGRRDIGIFLEQVQWAALVGHLVAAVGSEDEREGMLVFAGTGYGPV